MSRTAFTYAGLPVRLSVCICATVSLGCGGDAPASLSVETLASPAGEGSGEPFVSTLGDAVLLSWLEPTDSGHALLMARLDADGWTEPLTVTRDRRFFVNWADFPSVHSSADGTLWAHWLERGPSGGYDYGVRLVRSTDGGHSWSRPWTPHEDDTPTEHGFLSSFPLGEGMGFVWLDGRKFAPGADGSPATEEMTLRFRAVDGAGAPGPEVLVDGRICDCCQTDAAIAAAGPVVVYRDRTEEEIRDIYVTRYVDGAWTEGVPVHDDGWNIAGCPVNGPAVAARGEHVVVAWFTGAGNQPRVHVAHSADGGATFSEAHRVDDGQPGGRVDVLLEEDGAALVAWLERTGGENAEVRVRTVSPLGELSPSVTVASSSAARASGFPRMARAADGRVILAWTDADAGKVQVAAVWRVGS